MTQSAREKACKTVFIPSLQVFKFSVVKHASHVFFHLLQHREKSRISQNKTAPYLKSSLENSPALQEVVLYSCIFVYMTRKAEIVTLSGIKSYNVTFSQKKDTWDSLEFNRRGAEVQESEQIFAKLPWISIFIKILIDITFQNPSISKTACLCDLSSLSIFAWWHSCHFIITFYFTLLNVLLKLGCTYQVSLLLQHLWSLNYSTVIINRYWKRNNEHNSVRGSSSNDFTFSWCLHQNTWATLFKGQMLTTILFAKGKQHLQPWRAV